MKIRLLTRQLTVAIVVCLLAGCNLTTPNSPSYYSDARYSHYYLKIKQMSHADLVLEIDAQKQFQKMGIKDADLKLTLIYSLPNAPIHNPYTAKARINAYGLPMESNLLLSNDDVAFFTMLRDQLNEQLLILQQLSELETQHGYAKRKIIKQQEHIVTVEENAKVARSQHQDIVKEVEQLKKQINQLKLIEKSISQRDQ